MNNFFNRDMPTDDERTVYMLMKMNPHFNRDDLIEKMNVTPTYLDEMLEHLTYLGLTINNNGKKINHENVQSG